MVALFSASADVMGRSPVRVFHLRPSVVANVKLLHKRPGLRSPNTPRRAVGPNRGEHRPAARLNTQSRWDLDREKRDPDAPVDKGIPFSCSGENFKVHFSIREDFHKGCMLSSREYTSFM